jgi:hypothetical protein
MPKGWLRPCSSTWRCSATPSPSASRSSVMRLGLAPVAPARRMVAAMACPNSVRGRPGIDVDSATVTSPQGSTSIQRG